MKPKQLANVLIKILGLSVCVHAVPGFFSEIWMMLSSLVSLRTNSGYLFFQMLGSLGSGLLQLLIGVLLIICSRYIADLMFRNEEE